MSYPPDILFDIETLINDAQPSSILLLGDQSADFLHGYLQQKKLLGQPCEVNLIDAHSIDALFALQMRFDVAIALGLFEKVDKQLGGRILSRLRDVLCPQYCIALPLPACANATQWQRNELFAFALNMVASYPGEQDEYGLFKYNIADYKKTPDWLSADNWANPQMWGKYRW